MLERMVNIAAYNLYPRNKVRVKTFGNDEFTNARP